MNADDHPAPPGPDGTARIAVVLVPVAGLCRTFPLRDRVDARHVEHLATVLEGCPPIVVSAEAHLIDGEHRVHAARARGWDHLPATVVACPAEDLHLKAIELNTRASLALTRGERRAAVGLLLERHPDWADRRIAAVCGVSPSTVGAARQEVSGVQTGHLKRRGGDGKAYPAHPAARRRLAEDHLRLHPGATISELRAVTGASVGSVSTWRKEALEAIARERRLTSAWRRLLARLRVAVGRLCRHPGKWAPGR